MSRLIDADNLEEAIKEYFKKHITDNSCMVDGVDCSADICRFVKEQPTAFDVEKVVRELGELKMRYYLTIANTGDAYNDCAYMNIANTIDNTIDIVKRGGRDEQNQ